MAKKLPAYPLLVLRLTRLAVAQTPKARASAQI
jgi:hypothetical protein